MNTFKFFYFLGIVFFIFIFVNCEYNEPTGILVDFTVPDLAVPTILRPEDSAVFYANEEIIIEWELPDSIYRTQLQDIWLDGFYELSDKNLFDSSASNFGYGNVYTHGYILNENMTKARYLAYRLRSEIDLGVSEWTEIRSLAVLPIVTMEKRTIEVNSYISFKSVESNEYYSGMALSDSIDFISIISSLGYELSQIKVIRPDYGYIISLGGDSIIFDAFERLSIGYDDSGEFDIFADTYPPAWEFQNKAELHFYPNAGAHLNLRDFFINSQSPLKLAYILEASEYENRDYNLKVILKLDIYID